MHPVLLFICVFTGVVAGGTLLMAGMSLLMNGQKDDSRAQIQKQTEEWTGPENSAAEAENGGNREGIVQIEEAVHEEETIPVEVPPEQLTFAFAGDILLDENYAPMVRLKQRGFDMASCFSEDLWEEMHSADIFVVNNEFTYSLRGAPTEGKQFTFRAKPEAASYLKDMGVDLVSLANNHAYDYGEVSLTDTLDTLQKAGISYIGAGRNLEEAAACVSYEAGGKSVAVIAATQIERLDNPDTKGATDDAPGVFRCWNPKKLYETIERVKQEHDYVIVFIHWGTENTDELDWAQQEQAKKIAEAGADLIIGSHPHCLQEVGYIGTTPVIYSLGNYWFNSKTLDTCLVKVTFTEEGLQNLQLLPARQQDCKTSLLSGEEKNRVIAYLNGISASAVLDEEGYIRKQ